MEPSLTDTGYSVALVGEALGEDEAEVGRPFVGRAGFKLTRLIEWAGFDRSRFDIFNTVWCRPPDNRLEGESYEFGAISHCRTNHWGHLLHRNRVIVPMGNVATCALTGSKRILTIRGYVQGGEAGNHIIPTVHPSFIQRGQSKWSAAFINDLQKAVELARYGLPPQVTDYWIDPSPADAYAWARDYLLALERNPRLRLAFDIETPGKGEDEDELDTDEDLPDRTWNIERIGFSYGGLQGLSIPFDPVHYATIRKLLGSAGDKVVWNAGFDVPRCRRAGFSIQGLIHDGMVAWHILHTDLPKRLGFVATFTCPWQPAWKHLSGSHPGFYNVTDADVEWRSMDIIERELRRTGLWTVYQRDVLDLEPILVHMHLRGMPVSEEIRTDRAVQLEQRLGTVRNEMINAVPLEARRIDHVFVKPPVDRSGLLIRPGTREVNTCSLCGLRQPRKEHFRKLVKRTNPCAEAGIVRVKENVDEYYRLAEFKPSREQLIRYHQFLNRALPMAWDKKAGRKKVSFGVEQIKKLMLKYPLDKLYASVLSYRALDKLAGTYIGRPA